MATGPEIFERIDLPRESFVMHYLHWKAPYEKEDLKHYAKRIAEDIKEPNPVLIGVSFGGILVQEIASFIDAALVIAISTVKSRDELPPRMKIASRVKAYRFLPNNIVGKIEKVGSLTRNVKVTQRLMLYKKYLVVGDDHYLKWGLEKVVDWDRTIPDKNVVHIHGTKDEVFPSKYIKGFIPVENGTHLMILNKYKWLNENLPKIIMERSLIPNGKM